MEQKTDCIEKRTMVHGKLQKKISMYEVAYAAEKVAFEVGFEYATGLILESISAGDRGGENKK